MVGLGDLGRGAAHDASDADSDVVAVADQAVAQVVAGPHRALSDPAFDPVERHDDLTGTTGPAHAACAWRRGRGHTGGWVDPARASHSWRHRRRCSRSHAGEHQTAGDDRGGRPMTKPDRTCAVNLGHRSASGTSTVANGPVPDLARWSTAEPAVRGRRRTPASRRAARSRAIPAMHIASGRFASTAMSRTVSRSIPSASATGVPGSATVACSEDEQARPVFRKAEFSARAKHPLRGDALHLAPADLHAAGENACRRGASGTRSPSREIPCSADDLHLAASGIDGDPPDAVGAGNRGDPETGRPRRRARPSPTSSTPSTTRPRSSRPGPGPWPDRTVRSSEPGDRYAHSVS